MKRSPRPPWQAKKAATAKAMREFPLCKTPGCKGKATGISWGSLLCPKCKWGEKTDERKKQRAQTERIAK